MTHDTETNTPASSQDLARCARGSHKWRPIEDSDALVKCIHCGQVDEVPDCMFFVSPEQPECGEPGYTFVKVRNRLITATVPLCREHKATHDRAFSQSRTARKTA